jgi:hypothetical protein
MKLFWNVLMSQFLLITSFHANVWINSRSKNLIVTKAFPTNEFGEKIEISNQNDLDDFFEKNCHTKLTIGRHQCIAKNPR